MNLVSCGEDGRLLLWERKPPFAIAFSPDTNGMRLFDRELVLSADQRFCAVNGEKWPEPFGATILPLSIRRQTVSDDVSRRILDPPKLPPTAVFATAT